MLSGKSYSLEFSFVPNEDRGNYLNIDIAFMNGKCGRLLFGVANDGIVHKIVHDKVFHEKDTIVNSISIACSQHLPIDIEIENIKMKSSCVWFSIWQEICA